MASPADSPFMPRPSRILADMLRRPARRQSDANCSHASESSAASTTIERNLINLRRLQIQLVQVCLGVRSSDATEVLRKAHPFGQRRPGNES